MKLWTLHVQFLRSAILAGALLSTPAISLADEIDVDSRIRSLEQRLAELQENVSDARQIDLTTVEERLEKFERQQPPAQGGETGNMVFFRGGGAWATSDRANEVETDVFGFSGNNDGDNGYYVGAGLDPVISKDVWGMMSDTWVLGEIGVEFKRFNSEQVTQAVPTACAVAGVPTCTANTSTTVEITMLTVNIAPKIMFMEGSRLRPWIIPVGLDFHAISRHRMIRPCWILEPNSRWEPSTVCIRRSILAWMGDLIWRPVRRIPPITLARLERMSGSLFDRELNRNAFSFYISWRASSVCWGSVYG